MANLFGFLEYDHHARFVSRIASEYIRAGVETWHGRISVSLSKEGMARITISDKYGNNEQIIFTGNINNRLKK